MYQFLEFDQLDSTQLYARTLLDQIKTHTLITAKIQTHGIGQRGNKWISFSDNFCGSFIFHNILNLKTEHPGRIAIIMAAAIGQFFNMHQFKKFSFKWPNDIYDEQCIRKLAGILCEIHDQHLIVGIGINFLSHPKTLHNATSLTGLDAHYLLKNWDKLAFFKHLHHALLIYNDEGFDIFQHYWEQYCGHINKFIRTSCGKEGIFTALQTNGFPQFK